MKKRNIYTIIVKALHAGMFLSFFFGTFTSCTDAGGLPDTPKGQATGKCLYGSSGRPVTGTVVDRKNPLHGALLGAAGGVLSGGALGYYLNKRKKDLETALSPEINAGRARIQKLPGNSVEVSMTPKTAFAPGSTELNPIFTPTLRKIADVVKTYGKATVSVIGYPDSAGGAMDKATLADQRAEVVRDTLISMGIKPVLINASGNPEEPGNTGVIIQPLSDCSSPARVSLHGLM